MLTHRYYSSLVIILPTRSVLLHRFAIAIAAVAVQVTIVQMFDESSLYLDFDVKQMLKASHVIR
eukprot:scaffold36692_cov65-Cyclotella_meneghiniana.AAC.3